MPQSGELEGSCFSWFLDCIIHAFNRPAANTTPPLLSVDGPIDRGCLERGKRTVSYEVGMFLLRTLDASRGIRQFTDLQLSRAFRLFSGTRAALTQFGFASLCLAVNQIRFTGKAIDLLWFALADPLRRNRWINHYWSAPLTSKEGAEAELRRQGPGFAFLLRLAVPPFEDVSSVTLVLSTATNGTSFRHFVLFRADL